MLAPQLYTAVVVPTLLFVTLCMCVVPDTSCLLAYTVYLFAAVFFLQLSSCSCLLAVVFFLQLSSYSCLLAVPAWLLLSCSFFLKCVKVCGVCWCCTMSVVSVFVSLGNNSNGTMWREIFKGECFHFWCSAKNFPLFFFPANFLIKL